MARRNVVLAFRCSKGLFDDMLVYHRQHIAIQALCNFRNVNLLSIDYDNSSPLMLYGPSACKSDEEL
jgi:hypothetical protein